MEEKTTTLRNSPAPMLGWLIAPLAVMLAIAAIMVAGIDFDLDLNNIAPLVIVAIGAILGIAPRVLKENGAVNFSSSALSLATLGAAMVGHQAIIHLTDQGAFTALQFLVVAFGVFFFDSRGRHEFATILTFGMIGINVGMIAAGSYNTELDTIYTMPDESLVDTLNLQRQALGYVFFSYLTIFTALGLLVAVISRGVINPAGKEGWFSSIATHDGGYNKSTMPLQIAALVWILAHAGSLYHFDSVTMADKLGVTMVDGYHGHFGFWGAFFTGIVAMIVAGMASEKWYTRSMFVGSMWVLYLVSSWYEAGIWESEQLEGTWGALIWLGFTFFICVGIYMISTHEKYGGWANLDDHEASGARKFWDAHWASLMVGAAFFFGLVIRVQWYIVPSMNAYGTGTWDMTGGSDPWYMKRVVDYILANNAHLIFDADRSYPLGGVNPRPPLFTWSIALVSMALEPMLGDDAVWYAILGLPAIYGALTIFPIAAIARDNFGKATGVIAAWLIAFMPAHVSHSTWALADHDAFVMLFISMGFMFWFKAIKNSGNERLTKTSSPKIGDILHSFSVVAREKRSSMAFAVLAGVSFGVASLAWKGFVVGPSILFLAYFVQVALNMFRRKDSTTLNALFLAMLFSNLLMSLPFYGHPQLALVLDGTGLQPFLFILGFTLAISYVTTGFRDKPWLLVLGTLFAAATVFFTILFVLKQLEYSNAWDVLFTGSGYFTKTKIFGTVAEANAPDRGQLFAQLGPIVLVLALTMGFYALWSTFRNKNQSHLFFGIWIFVATYMSWTAARFMFNATPAVAVLGAWGIVALWNKANWQGLVRTWKKFGIRTPADRIAGARRAVWRTPSFSAILLIVVLLGGQQFTYGLDSAIPGSDPSEDDLDENIYNIIPDALRWELAGFSILDSSAYSGNWYLGSFGSGFNDQGWNSAYDWMTQQDAQMDLSERPAFVSWWDYGFQALSTGAHPSVSDNFQSGIPASGNMLLARSQTDLVSMFVWQLATGDIRYNQINSGDYEITSGFENVIENNMMTSEQHKLFIAIQEERDFDKMKEYIDDYAFTVIQTNEASQVQENSKNVMASGYHRVNGIADTSMLYYRMYQDGERIICDPEVSTSCVDGDWSDFDDANVTFNSNVRSGQETQYKTTHYIFGDYWYTNDLRDELDSVSTHIHRANTRIALTVQLLSDVMSDSQIIDLYDDLISMEDYYHVQDYNGLPGDTISRDHEIRYFAIDNRLYPRAGRYTADYNYNQGQPMGIFGAPTILSGQDISTFMDEVYETSRGSRNFEMTRIEVDDAMTNDFLDQQAGLDIDPLQVQDVRVDHNPEFFDTMLARTYVGYGASSLGVDSGFSNPQPAQHFGQSGSPGSILQQAVPLPGAMTNHFVISNWYNEDNNFSIGSANTLVKIMKYYSGAEISGSVTMSENGEPLPGVRLLVERDAFSGEGSIDLDEDTYWIPIGFTDADENGEWSFHAPAGKIRVSAFVGTFDAEPARATINDGSYAQGINDLLTEENDNRQVNAVTAILGNVANMTWLGETQYNVTGEQANRTDAFTDSMDIEVDSSGISGQLTWSGDELFDGEAIVDTTIILRNIHDTSSDVLLETTNGSFSTDETRIIQGTGQATYSENGTFESEGLASVFDFHGTFTRTIGDGRTYVANGTWNGTGEIKTSWIDLDTALVANCVTDSNDPTNITMPSNETVCLKDDTGELPVYMINGEVSANGRFTSEGNTILVQEHDGSSFEGIGFFEGTGTFNGTGRFVGSGAFSGEMVSPGSFYQTGIVPGEYEVTVSLENGRDVLLPQTINVGINPEFGIALTMPGSLIAGNLTNATGGILTNTSFEIIDNLNGDSTPVQITTNDTGGYRYGPISSGEYEYRIDLDEDGFYEVSGIISVGDETEVFEPINIIPDMYDVSISIQAPIADNGSALVEVGNQSFTLTNAIGLTETYESDEAGIISMELNVGEYVIEQTGLQDYYLYSTFSVDDEDLSFGIDYAVASTLTGQILAYTVDYNENWTQVDIDKNTTAASMLDVTLTSGDNQFDTITDIDGNFSITVPGDLSYVLKATTTANTYGVGLSVEPNEISETNLGSIYLSRLNSVSGLLSVNATNSSWSAQNFNGLTPTILAVDEYGIEWEAEVTATGTFTLNLANGIYDFSGSEGEYNIEVVEDWEITTFVETQTVSMMADLQPVSVAIEVCLVKDVTGDCSEGIPKYADITITSQVDINASHKLGESDFDEFGTYNLEIMPGRYTLQTTYTDSSDENATDFNMFFTTQEIFVSMFAEDNDAIIIELNDERLFNGKITVGQDNFSNTQFLLYNESNNQWLSATTNDTGEFSQYIPSGDWIVIVSPQEIENTTYTLRYPLAIDDDSSTRTNLVLALEEAVRVNATLVESLTDEFVVNARLLAVSNDGYGNVTLASSDDSGNVTDVIMPGSWTLSLLKETDDKRWSIEDELYTFVATNQDVELGNLTVDLEVLIGGKIYWDFNENDITDVSELVAGANITITSSDDTLTFDLITDDFGVWSQMVPVMDTYNVTVEKSGYSSGYYTTNETQGMIVDSDSVKEDLSIVADNVQVSGIVTSIMQDEEASLTGSTITLYPETGRDLTPVTLSGDYDNGELTWSTSVEPGNWVVVVESTVADENTGGVSIGYLNAGIEDGGELEMVMSSGGYIQLNTVWQDIQLGDHHAGSDSTGSTMIDGLVEVTIDAGIDVTWNYTLDSVGELNLLLPVGDFQISSTFTTIQHERMLDMKYTGNSFGIIEQGIIDVEMSYTRTLNSASTVAINGESIVNATFTDTAILTPIVNNEDYDVIEFDLDLVYEGTENSDVLTIGGRLSNTIDSEDWTVEVFNGTEWTSESEVTLGIGESLSDDSVSNSTTVKMRVILPNVTSSLSLENGHLINIEVSSETGISSSVDLRVKVPQYYGMEITSAITETGVSPGGTGSFSFTLTNTGNGDDSFNIELADNLLEGWQITPVTSTLTISKDDQRTQQFSIFAPESFTSGEVEATVTITSEDGITSETITVSIQSARISLDVDETLSQELTKVYESQQGQIVVPITNSGYRTASTVLVTVNLTNDLGNEVLENIGNQTISVPAGQTINATFVLGESSKKFNRYAISVDILGEDNEYVEDSIEPFDYQEETILDTAEPTSGWFMVVIVVLTALVAYGGLKVSRNKSSNRF